MRVGLVYDPAYLRHDTGWHVEKPERLTRTLAALEEKGLLDRLEQITPRAASVEEVALVHSREYIESIEVFCRKGGGHLDPDTAASPESFAVALLAAGGTITAVEAVVAGTVSRAFALVRPPGHHALPDRAMGFCLFNNVAVAARWAAERYSFERILVVDWDYHHGNGTEAAFYRDPGVLYFSTHSAVGYPGTGWVDRVGEGPGRGFNINVPLPETTRDIDLWFVFQKLLVPVAAEYRPELVLVSAGQDGYRGDPIAGMRLTADGYGWLAAVVAEIADRHAGGRLAAVLEGGYDLHGLGECVAAIFKTWQGEPKGSAETGQVDRGVAAAVAAVKEIHREYWQCFRQG
ncbi:MAG: histone deacetylase [Thermoanaerobacteraceae bacterium]|nr:histone deacetylase [Thermoanaerobacteraceae bacterium]